MKKKIVYVIAVLIISLTTACGNPKLKNGEEIVAKIDGKEYSAEQLYEELKGQYGYSVLMNWIDTEIANKEVKTTDEITKYVDEAIEFYTYYAESYGMTLPNFAANYLGLTGIESEDDLRAYIEIDKKLNIAITNKVAEKISDKEIEDFYNENYKSIYTYREILIANDENAEGTIEKIKESLNDKENEELINEFESLAKEYSTSASAADGGLVKKASKNIVAANVWEEIESLEDNEYSEAIETDTGIYFVLRISKDKTPKIKDVKKEIKETIAQKMLEEDQFLSYNTLTELRNKYKIAFFDDDIKKTYNEYLNEIDTAKKENESNTEEEE